MTTESVLSVEMVQGSSLALLAILNRENVYGIPKELFDSSGW